MLKDLKIKSMSPKKELQRLVEREFSFSLSLPNNSLQRRQILCFY